MSSIGNNDQFNETGFSKQEMEQIKQLQIVENYLDNELEDHQTPKKSTYKPSEPNTP